MIKRCDRSSIKASDKIRTKGKDYFEDKNNFIIPNVPILAEMVQDYDDGVALKSSLEIKKVAVDKVPLTMASDFPDHPPDHLSNLDTFEKKDYVVGYMSEVSKPKSNMSDKKRYADFVIFKTPKAQVIIDTYKEGNMIDTSIGFKFKQDFTPGNLAGEAYDYVQTDIVLDHNAILIDEAGRIGTGRMPTPVGGMGADSKGKGVKLINDADINGSLQALANQIVQDNPDIDEKGAYALLADEMWEIRKQKKFFDSGKKMTDDKAIQEQLDSLKKENDTLKKQIEDSKSADKKEELDTLTKTLKETEDKLKASEDKQKTDSEELEVFRTKETERVDNLRKEVVDANPDFADLLEKADASVIEQKHADMKKKEAERAKDSHPISADMFGAHQKSVSGNNAKFDKVFKAEKKEVKG